ncbi:TetR family transcriptional regulator [Roseomonas sp. BN140053]|uniref:TetR family transcriptional regulator n=1 Tax=Roseomonas sp. BN140053 TaxID=3391898 RepID=UPI0039ED383D
MSALPTRRREPEAGEPAPARRGRRRGEILRRAAEIFGRQGVAHTSLEDIAAAVGLRREAVYYYYRDKTEILCDVIRPQSEALLHGMERLMALDAPAAARLALAIGSHLERFNPNYLEMSVAFRELSGQDPAPGLMELRRVWKRYEQHWVELVRQGQATGEFDPAHEPKMAAFAILGMCNGVSGWYRPDGGVAMADLVRSYTTLALGGLLRPGAAGAVPAASGSDLSGSALSGSARANSAPSGSAPSGSGPSNSALSGSARASSARADPAQPGSARRGMTGEKA